jgi:ribonuclease P protein component
LNQALSQSFPRDYRLLKELEFKRVFAQPRKSSDAWFTVFARASAAADGPARLGLAIARKQLKRAVERNRIKRLTREYFRLHVAPTISGIDYVVMARAKAKEQSCKRLRHSLDKHFQKLQQQMSA